ncbi:MAG: GlsB/YeaQ/YmgE family stress response membrane protein [Saprospiraceae bacterium]
MSEVLSDYNFIMDIVIMLLTGAALGWLGSLIFTGRGLGLYGNIIVGLLGSVLGYWLFGEFGINLISNLKSTLLSGLSGAIFCLTIANLIFPGRKP